MHIASYRLRLKPSIYYRCEASCVAVTVAIALMLQKNERHLKRTGKFDIESVIDESYMYSSQLLNTNPEVQYSLIYYKLGFIKGKVIATDFISLLYDSCRI